MTNHFHLSQQTLDLAQQVQAGLEDMFCHIDQVAESNVQKVLSAFRSHRVGEAHFAGTTGYGYDDLGRDTLDKIYAEIFHTEDALVRIQFVNGTHTIGASFFGVLRPGDKLVYVTGKPYDTIQTTLGISGNESGNLRDWGISYGQVELQADGSPDLPAIEKALEEDKTIAAVVVQRSPGYSTRESLSVAQIGDICRLVHEKAPGVAVLVDNCYGEFVEELEPTDVGADLVMGSLIKNPGGGLAPMGGYIAGKHELVEKIAARLTVPGIGRECGATLGNNRAMYQGLFMAPHTVAQALKTAVFCAGMMEKLGFETCPRSTKLRHDIVQTIAFGEPEALKSFCRGIQAASPIDSYVTPEPWAMPGYDCDVIMAAGAFIQGSSIELSCDAPMREPYMLYLQGGLTYESGKAGIMLAVDEILKNRA